MLPFRSTLSAFSAVVFLALAACGGGSGGGDALDPDVIATSPAPFETGVDPQRPVLVDLGVDLDPAADFQSFLRVQVSAGDVPGTWAYDAGDRRLTFVADAGLILGATHVVTLDAELPYADGSSRTNSYSFQFDVRPPAPVVVEPSEDRAESIAVRRLVTHPNGTGMLLLGYDLPSGDRRLVVRRKRPAGGFEAPVTILEADDLRGSVLRVDASGNAALVWRYGPVNGPYNLAMRYYERATDTWRGTRFLETSPQRSPDRYEVAVDGQGNVFAFWREEITGTDTRRLAGRRYQAGGLLDPTWFSGTTTGSIFSVRLDANAHGDAIAAWDLREAGDERRPHAVLYDRTTAWGASEQLDSLADRRIYVREARISNAGTAALFVELSTPGVNNSDQMGVIGYAPVGSPVPGWGAAVPLHADPGYVNDYAMHMSDDAVFVATFTRMDESDVGSGAVRVARFTPDRGVYAQADLTIGNAFYLYDGNFHSHLSPVGDLVVAWTEEDVSVESELFLGVQRADGSVRPQIFVDRLVGDLDHFGLEVAAGSGGSGLLVWNEDDLLGLPDSETLFLATLDTAGVVSPKTPLSNEPDREINDADVAMDETGAGIVSWTDTDVTTDHTDARHIELR